MWGGALGPADQAIFEVLKQQLPEVEGVAGNIGYYAMALAPSFAVGKLPLMGEVALNAAQAAGMGANPAVGGVVGGAMSKLRLPVGKWSPRNILERSAERNLEKGVLGGGGKEWVKERFKARRPEIFEQRWLRGSHEEQAAKAKVKASAAGEQVEAMRMKYGPDILPDKDYDAVLTHMERQVANRATDVDTRYGAEFRKLRDEWFKRGHQELADGRVIRRPVTIDDLYEFVHGRPIDVGNPKSSNVGGLDALVKWERSQDATQQLAGEVARVARHKFVETMVKGKPDFEEGNKAFSLMADIRAMTKQTAKRKTGQIGLIPKMAAAGAGYGAATVAGENRETAGLTAILGASAVMFLQSPRYQMVAAGLKHRLARSLANGQFDQARRVLDRMMAQTTAQATAGAQ